MKELSMPHIHFLSSFAIFLLASACTAANETERLTEHEPVTPSFCSLRTCVSTYMPIATIKEQRGPDFSVYHFEYRPENEGPSDVSVFRFGYYEGSHPNFMGRPVQKMCSIEIGNDITLEGFGLAEGPEVEFIASKRYETSQEFFALAPTTAHVWFDSRPNSWRLGDYKLSISFFGEDLDFNKCSENN